MIMSVKNKIPRHISRKPQELFRPVKLRIFSSSVEVLYTPETSCMKGTSLRIKNLGIKQLCNHKVLLWLLGYKYFFGTFKKQSPGHHFFKHEFERIQKY